MAEYLIASLIKRFSNWKSLNIAKIQNLKQLHAKEIELKYARKASNQGVNFIQVTPKTLGQRHLISCSRLLF